MKVTVLSTMLAGDRSRGIGEWGFAALLEVDGQRLLIDTGLRPFKASYEALGGVFVEHAGQAQLLPAVWLTGPVPRQYPERNYGSGRVQTPTGIVEDDVPEDASVIVDTPDGLVLVSGCGRAGIINTIEYARKIVRQAPVVAAVGGFHLFSASDATLEWTGSKLKEFKLQYLLGAHCTGIEAVHRLRALLGLTRKTAVVGAVGSSFTLGTGISALSLAS